MKLSIIIVNWNTKNLLDKCLTSVLRETKNVDFEIFVVDNASSDGSTQMVQEKYPEIKLIANKENRGFAAANNQAIKQAAGDYVLMLNPDAVILNNAGDKAISILQKRPEAGILGPKTYNKDGSVQKTVRKNPGLTTQLIFPSKMKQIFPGWKTLKNYYQENFDYEQEQFAEQIQGSFMLIKKEVFDKIGLLDEKFFIWFEEVDFCQRAREAGFKIIYSPSVEINHCGSESFIQVPTLKKQGIYNRSLLYYFWKHKPKWQFFILYLFKFPFLFF